jgi:[acyl-carrier-protein] S-malonyltransferase
MKTALLFAGQGAQSVGMGKELCDRFSSARAWFERANAALGYDLARICFEGPESELTKTEHAQPGIFLVGWIAFQLLKEQAPSLQFEAATGLSLGEFTALAAAGAFSFEEGLALVRQRGRFMQEACEATQGGMAALIGLDETGAQKLCAETGVEIANLNCPGQIVISGATEKLKHACAAATSLGAKKAIPLSVAGAYHSRLMAVAQPKLEAALAGTNIRPLAVPVISNVSAREHGTPPEVVRSLVAQVVSSVRWEASMRYLLEQGFTRFIELGPGTALSGFMRRIDKNAVMFNVADAGSLEKTVNGL